MDDVTVIVSDNQIEILNSDGSPLGGTPSTPRDLWENLRILLRVYGVSKFTLINNKTRD